MNTINKQITKWFDKGNIKEAIIGEKPFFIPDVTYRDKHDRILVLRQLLLWADMNNNGFEVATIIQQTIVDLCSFDKICETLDIVWCFLLIKEDMQIRLPIDMRFIENELVELIKKNVKELSINEELREVVLSLSEKLPDFRRKLAL
ncbi:hypothetical protein [Desulfoluna sp.]|uniref:hypothetical protein n=1 Tax=Desulfoluna sp. TaxID=2045199 RepID=UPI00260FB4B5|nr:hypothetical protein [Desulfoluna sp.]